MINIRSAVISDAPFILAGEQLITQTPGYLVSRPHELTLKPFEDKIRHLTQIPNGIYVVAESTDVIIAHAFLDPMGLEAIQHVLRLTIAVYPGHEEKGTGKLLMNHLLGWARSNPLVEKIELNVRASNQRAINLYQGLGFEIEGRIKNRQKISDGHYIDDILMGLFVSPV